MSGAAANAERSADVELRGLHKQYGGIVAVESLDLRAEPGEFVSLLGPSGCGKTTTLRAIAGLTQPDGGLVIIGGRVMNDVPVHRRGLGLVPQNYALFPHMTVMENVTFGLRMRRTAPADVERMAREALGTVQLAGLEDRYPRQLSGGQQQRVALARCLVVGPSVLLLDEPLGALDKKLREAMQVELKSLQRQVGITTIFVTHDQEEALTMSDRIAVMQRGRLQQFATPQEIYEAPRNRFVAEFIGVCNFLKGGWPDGTGRPSCSGRTPATWSPSPRPRGAARARGRESSPPYGRRSSTSGAPERPGPSGRAWRHSSTSGRRSTSICGPLRASASSPIGRTTPPRHPDWCLGPTSTSPGSRTPRASSRSSTNARAAS